MVKASLCGGEMTGGRDGKGALMYWSKVGTKLLMVKDTKLYDCAKLAQDFAKCVLSF